MDGEAGWWTTSGNIPPLARVMGVGSQQQHNTKMKVATLNNLLRKLSSSKWGTNASTIRTTALALSYSVAEYASSVWERSAHAYKLDSELNSACRAITGCLKPTNVEEDILPTKLVAPLPNSEKINRPFTNHTYTKSTPNHIHHHYSPFVTLTHRTHTEHTSLQLYPHTHHVIIHGFVD